jgi:ATP-dependent helicase/nuclease subunit A
VILADATADPAKLGRTPLTLDLELQKDAVPLLRPKKDERCEPFAERIAREEKRDLEEHMRLLYVALTRAADRLIVAGVAPKAKKDGSDGRPENCWHRIVERAMLAAAAQPVERPWGTALVYGAQKPVRGRKERSRVELGPMAAPQWALRPAPAESRPPRPLAPSAIAIDAEAAPPPSEAMRAAARRGTVIHQLLERLVAVDPGDRAGAARKWLERSAGVADEAERDEIVEQVCAILSDERFSALFGSGSLGEAPLAATLPDGRVIAGTVDRILVEPGRVSVIDFKTGRVPASKGAIPDSHRAQMVAYAAALRAIFPGREVRTALLYTAGPVLLELTP